MFGKLRCDHINQCCKVVQTTFDGVAQRAISIADILQFCTVVFRKPDQFLKDFRITGIYWS